MTDMREAVARALCLHMLQTEDDWLEFGKDADAALSLMQPEIDRRVAEERAKLLERLLSLPPSIYDGPTRYISFDQVLAQFEKENSHEQG